MKTPSANRRASAERKRLYRERQKAGLRVYQIVADEIDLADKLVAGGWLSPLMADDFQAQLEALEKMVAAIEVVRNR